jgi:hypothetical protein
MCNILYEAVQLQTLVVCSASQEFSRLLWNPNVHYHVYNSLPPAHILTKIKVRRPV